MTGPAPAPIGGATALDAQTLRAAFGQFATGVCIIGTTGRDGAQLGATVNSFTSVSLDPPLILVCLGQGMRSHDDFATASGFGVSVAAQDQQDLARHFASRADDKWCSLRPQTGTHGGLMLPRALARFDCRTETCLPGGDHTILIGRVVRVEIEDHAPPLLFFRGGFGAAQPCH